MSLGFSTGCRVAVCKRSGKAGSLLGGSWDLVSKVISTLIGVISIVTLFIIPLTKSHDPSSRGICSVGPRTWVSV